MQLDTVALYYLLCRYYGERRIPWRIRAHSAFDRNALGQRRVRSGDPRRNRTGHRSLSRHGRGSRDARAPRKKGLVSSWIGEPTAERGGKAKRHFKMEGAGVAALKDARKTLERLQAGLSLRTV